uniref:N-acetylmuramoyl-L-alanine amidase n=1 Tax=Glossina brevipalpis TaxID=37001 RepID=A0A1A9W7T5_9MUSC
MFYCPSSWPQAALSVFVAVYLTSLYTQAQENAQLQIPPSLVECYNDSYFLNRDNRLPANIETLINLIEKIENSYAFNQDMRQLAVSLLHRFRQDGIQRAPGVMPTVGVLPFSPTGFQFPKFRILLSRLIPGDARRFPNDTLTREERCSLHFMLSSSVDTQVRGDEHQVCNKLAQYRAERLPRDLQQKPKNNFIGDVEMIDNLKLIDSKRTVSRIRTNAKAQEYEFGWTESDFGTSHDNDVSQCPVENGVIHTDWGTVATGTLIAGIAAGLQPQTVQLKTLLALASRRPGLVQNLPQTATVNVDNRWAATLAGDLAEVALVQMPVTSTETASIGANGAWNSSVIPRWYFLSQRQNMEITDAEIRGGLDGLIIAMNIANWRTQAPNLKLSQLLRMYYSMDGVLGSEVMACNRKENFPTYAPLNVMIAQTSAFAQVLDREIQLKVTLAPEAIAQFSTEASNSLTSYIPQYLNDVSCSVSSALPQDITDSITIMTNVYVYLDMSWPYEDVVDYVNYILKDLNINAYASSITLLAAADGSVIVNTTNFLSDVFQTWNASTHRQFSPGFNLPEALRSLEKLTKTYMQEEKTNSSVGGFSMVALMMPYMATLSDGDSNYATTQLQYMTEQIPDLYFIYYAGGTTNRFAAFVKNPAQDLYALNVGTNVASSADPVLRRIKKIPRRIINPRCGSDWYTSTWGTDQMSQYARPGVINFYRLASNYFYGSNTGRFVKIQAQNYLEFIVCTSRWVKWPQQNLTNPEGEQSCRTVQSNTFTYDLTNACKDYPTIHQCPALYLSVQASEATSGKAQTVSCTEAACQTPDQARYVIAVENLGCFSSGKRLVGSFLVLILMSILRQILIVT